VNVPAGRLSFQGFVGLVVGNNLTQQAVQAGHVNQQTITDWIAQNNNNN